MNPGWNRTCICTISFILIISVWNFHQLSCRLRACLHGSRAGPLSEKEVRSRLPGWKFLHINTCKRASPVYGMKVQRYRCKLFLTTVKTIQCNKIVPASRMKFSHINTREIHPAYRAVSLSGPGRLPYKQALNHGISWCIDLKYAIGQFFCLYALLNPLNVEKYNDITLAEQVCSMLN